MNDPEKSKKYAIEKNHRTEKDKSDQLDADKAGQEGKAKLTLGKVDKLLKKQNFKVTSKKPKKRIYRKTNDLFDPDSAPESEANRTSLRLSTRVSRRHVEFFNIAAHSFPSKRAALERAIELLYKEFGNEIEPK